MITFEEVIENELISDRILEYIPRTCEICGKPIVFSDNLKFIQCSNSRCSSKVAARLEAMCKYLKIDGFGESTCLVVAKHIIGPGQLLLFVQRTENLPQVPGWSVKRNNVIKCFEKPIYLWEYMKALNLPGISGTAKELLNGYDNLDKFYEDLYEQQVPMVAARLGLNVDSDSAVLALSVYNTLIEYEGEVKGCVQFFNIKKDLPGTFTLNVCITQKVPGYASKPQYIDHLRTLVGPGLNIVQVDRVTEKTHILVGDSNSGTGKMKRAKAINEKAGQQVVFIGGPEQVDAMVSDLYKRLSAVNTN